MSRVTHDIPNATPEPNIQRSISRGVFYPNYDNPKENEGWVSPAAMTIKTQYLQRRFHLRNLSPSLDRSEEKEPPQEESWKWRLNMEAALVHDGLLLLSEAAGSSAASRSMKVEGGRPCNVSCAEERPWGKGATLFNYLNSVRLQGITGSLALEGRKRAIGVLTFTICNMSLMHDFQGGTRGTLDLEVMHYTARTNEVRIE